jgi:thioredoxin reductase (NADPH)
VVELRGGRLLEGITWRNHRTGENEVRPIHHLFLMLGAVPNTQWLNGCLELDEKGFIVTGTGGKPGHWPLPRPVMLFETSVPSVFAAGDVRSGSTKRVASAVGEGAMAVSQIHQALADLNE